MEQLFNILDVFLQNSKVASLFFLILMGISPWTQGYFTQTWHYVALRVNALLFFLPLAPICEKIAPYLLNILPIKPKTEVILPETVGTPWYYPVEYFSEIGENGGTVGADFVSTAEGNLVNWTEIFLLLWVIGSMLALIWHGYCRIRLEKELKPLIPLGNPEIHAVLEQCKQEKNINARIKLFSSHKLYSPLLVGLFRVKILFPNKKMEEKHLEYIFSHELTHYKRGDLWWKALLSPLSVIFWWNPLIYYFMAQFELSLEYSCDEKVVEKSSMKERKSYGLAILESIDEKKQEKMKLFGVSLRTPEQKLERRLKNMLKFNEMKTSQKLLSGVLMSAMLLGAAAPTLENALSEPKVSYDDPWDVPGKTGVSVNNLLGVNDRDEKNFTEEEWEEIMRRVDAGTMEYYVFTEEALALEDFIKENFLPTHVISASSDSHLPSLTSSEKLNIFQYYVENNCSGIVNIRGEKGEITISCYNSDGDMIVSHDLGKTWELASEDDWNYRMDSAVTVPQEAREENQQSKIVVYDHEEVSEMVISSAKQMSQEELEFLRLGISPDDESNYSSEEWTALMQQIMDGEIPLFLPSEVKTWHISEQGISWSSEEDTAFGVLVDLENSVDFSGSVTIQNMDESLTNTSVIHMDDMMSQEDYGKILEENPNIQSFEVKIVAVVPEDEVKFTPEAWAEILEKVESGEIQMMESLHQKDPFSQGGLLESSGIVASERMQHPLRDADFYFSDSSFYYDSIFYYAAEEGTNIYPSGKGTVLDAGFEANVGNYVIISHESGTTTHYRHCKELFVTKGDEVGMDDIIATVGRTGTVTGYALGFGIFSK